MIKRTIKNGVNIWTHDDGDVIADTIMRTNDYFEGEQLRRILPFIRESKIIFEIGANIGNHVVFYNNYTNFEIIEAFEPLQKNIDILKKNISENKIKGVKINSFGLSNFEGETSFFVNDKNYGASSIERHNSYEVESKVNLKRADKIFGKWDKGVDFIKCDIEGAESGILEEIFAFAEKNNSVLWIELRPVDYGLEYMEKIQSLVNKYRLIYNSEYDFVFDFSKKFKTTQTRDFHHGYIHMIRTMYDNSISRKEMKIIRNYYKKIDRRHLKPADYIIWSKFYRFFSLMWLKTK